MKINLWRVWDPYLVDMLHIILADSELETIPSELWTHPSVVRDARRREKKAGNLLLDSTFHHSAIRKFFPGEENRRGRPDIVHYFLLNTLESYLNKKNLLRVYVHTRNDEVIFVNPETKIPKSYNRFVGLIESLFLNRYVPDKEKPLLWMKEMGLRDLVNSLNVEDVFLLTEKGKRLNIENFLSIKDQVFIIGGFSSGDFQSKMDFVKESISVCDESLLAWVVAYEIIVRYEIVNKIF